MDAIRITKREFYVIGKERSIKDGDNYINDAINEFKANYDEVKDLAIKYEDGTVFQIWG